MYFVSFILSVDPSSTTSGLCLLKNGEPTIVDVFKSTKDQDIGLRLYEFAQYLQKFKGKTKLSLVAVEQVGMIRNPTTVRLLSYFTGVVLIKAGEWNVPTMQLRTTSARKITFGKGNIDKEDVYNILRKKYNLLDYKNGGSDEADAITIGIAGHKKLNEIK